jgi:hypothetical protein
MNAAATAETIWTLIPRGISNDPPTKGKMRFTAFVSPAKTSRGSTDPLNDVWVHWYDIVASAADGGNKQFLQIKCNDPSKTLQVSIASACPVMNSVNGTPQALWKLLWNDLIRTFPDHLSFNDPPLPSAAHASPPFNRGHLVNASFARASGAGQAPSTSNAIEAAWMAGQITSCGLDGRGLTKVVATTTLVDVHSQPAEVAIDSSRLPSVASLRTRSLNQSELAIEQRAVDPVLTQQLEVAKTESRNDSVLFNTLAGKPVDDLSNYLDAVVTAIKAWTTAVTVPAPANATSQQIADAQAVLTMNRDFARLSSDPFRQLKVAVLAYIYETRRGQQSGAPFDSVRKATSDRLREAVDYAVFHQRCSSSLAPDSSRWDNSSNNILTYGPFLKVLGDLGNYPPLLRCLGLAFDLVTVDDASKIAWSSVTQAWIDFIDPTIAASLGAVGQQPSTSIQQSSYVRDGGDGKTDFHIKNGYLVMDEDYFLVDYDPDGSVLRRIQNATSPPQASTSGAGGGLLTSISQAVSGAQPIRNAGLSLRNDNTPNLLRARVQGQITKRAAANPSTHIFTAADLVRGYAPEVFWRGRWYSLTARQETYTDTNGNNLLPASMQKERASCPIQLEAAVHYDQAANSGTDVPPYDPHIASSLFRWYGWSLSLPHPFTATNGTHQLAAKPQSINPIKQNTSAPQTILLPKLRYGEAYQFRVRAIDLAGDPIEGPSAPDEGCSGELPESVYLRHDPVSPPMMLFEETFDPTISPGEQIDVLVARAEDDWYAPIRFLCPPAADLFSLIEQGALDRGDGAMSSPLKVGSFDDVVITDDGAFPQNAAGVPVYKSGPHTPAPGSYLPDRFASNVCFQLFDIATGTSYGPILPSSFYDQPNALTDRGATQQDYVWPHAGHVRVEMRTSSSTKVSYTWTVDHVPGAPSRNAPKIVFYIPRGWQMELLISCAPTLEQAKKMAAGRVASHHSEAFAKCVAAKGLAVASLTEQDVAVEKLLASGRSTVYTPARPINLVHAVKRPLGLASFSSAAFAQPVADSAIVMLSGDIGVGDGRTTAAVNVMVKWDEYHDDPTEPAPRIIHHSQNLCQLQNIDLAAVFKAGNSKPTDDLLPNPLEMKDQSVHFPSCAARTLDLVAAPISRFQHFYVQSAVGGGSSQADQVPFMGPYGNGLQKKLVVPNTTIPIPPVVSHILPLMPAIASPGLFRRIGGALRIYLNRGWYSSGEGELLGVVVATDKMAQCGSSDYQAWITDPLLSTLFTRWGADPVWDIAGIEANNDGKRFAPAPTQTEFTPMLAVNNFETPQVFLGVGLQDASSATATILGYTPVFTPEDGWHCDIILKQVPSYHTFLKLVLVRYQPNSIDSKSISHVTLPPFVQLRPNRVIQLGPRQQGHSHLLTIFGTAPGSNSTGAKTTFQVVVEVHHDGGWVSDTDTTITSPGAACSPQAYYEDGTGNHQPRLDAYVLTVTKHHHRRRRVAVREYELQTTYDPVTLNDTSPLPYLVDTSQPIELPHS